MNLTQLAKDPQNTEKYDYYRSLGYSEKASELLSLLTYGDQPLHHLLKEFPEDHLLDRLYGWLLERPEETPEDAVHAWYRQYRAKQDKSFKAAAANLAGGAAGFFGNVFGGMKSANMSAPKGLAAPMTSPAMGSAMKMSVDIEDVAIFTDEPVEEGGAVEEAGPEPAAGPGLAELSSTDSYEQIEEKKARSVLTEPTSTFRMTTNTSSMGIVLNQIREGRKVDLSQVRIEELLNFFAYDEELPKEEKFRIHTELYPAAEGKELLYIHAGARVEEKKGQNIILLLDVSGSMCRQKKVTQEILATVVSRLQAGDSFSMVTYSDNDQTIYDGCRVNGDGDKEDIMGRILGIVIDGCTYGSRGIETAYSCGAKHYIEGGNNQVILITDGDLNFGITKNDGLKVLIEEKKKSRLFLSVIGTGLYNYKDDKLEVLSKHGNGTYCVVNTLADVKESVFRRYESLTSIVAKDVKAQVEFNPRYVKEYRLLGYENRSLSHADFADDTVISEPYGSGAYGVALYEIKRGSAEGEQPLKYQKAVFTDSEELCTVKLRFKEPLSDESTELAQAVTLEENGGDNARLAYFLYIIGEKLRSSDLLDEADESFFAGMLKDEAWKKLPGGNEDKIELLLSYLKRRDGAGS